MKPLVGLLMGSRSDWNIMEATAQTLDSLGVPYEAEVISAHRAPDRLAEYAASAAERGLEVIIAGAGMSAALPGACAAKTALPVLGVPIDSGGLGGLDALLAMAQMPPGVPVATFGVGKAGATNAALFAAAILAAKHLDVAETLSSFRKDQTQRVLDNPDPRAPNG